MDIKGINKAKLLAALFNRSQPVGFGFLDFRSAIELSQSDAQAIIDQQGFEFDYLNGRAMKVDISGDDMETGLYNRDNGDEAAESVITKLKNQIEQSSQAQIMVIVDK